MIFVTDIPNWHATLGNSQSRLTKWMVKEKYKLNLIGASGNGAVDFYVKLVDGKSPAQMIAMMESVNIKPVR